MRLVRFCLLLALLFHAASSWWIFSSRSSSSSPGPPSAETTSAIASKTPFEIRTAEDKFLAQAQSYLELPPLDGCLHKVVARLRKACAEIGEEDLAKFSVQLLNCQSEAEGRQQYTCTDQMTVAECTKEMDSNTWNAYHIVSNRARSVCYATRQKQFQMRTELTVNHLANSAAEQIGTMETIKEGQKIIEKTASDTLEVMTEGQRQLIDQQTTLKQKQTEITKAVSMNLQRLNHEKSVIASGQQQLASMTEDIRARLENTSKQLESQNEDRRLNHVELLQDITRIQDKAKDVWEKIDHSTNEILRRHSDTLVQYHDMVGSLQRMNETINYLLRLVSELQLTVDNQIGWLADQIGGTGDQIGVILSCIQHAGYLFVAMICLLFIHAPVATRLVLLASVSLNTVAEIKSFPYRMDLRQLTAFLAVVLILNWTLDLLNKRQRFRLFGGVALQSRSIDCDVSNSSSVESKVKQRLSDVTSTFVVSRPVRDDNGGRKFSDTSQSSPDNSITCQDCSDETSEAVLPASNVRSCTAPGTSPFLASNYPSVAVVTPLRKRVKPSTPLSSTPDTPSRCRGITKSGLRCRVAKVAGSEFCKRHKSTVL